MPPPGSAPGSTAPPPVVGLLGGIGSGKSEVARQLATCGALVFDADALAHEALNDPALRAPLRATFGNAAFGSDGLPDRGALGRIVFAPDGGALRAALEGLLHPVVLERIRTGIAAARTAVAPPTMIVLDVPLIAEHAQIVALCDRLVFIATPLEQRLARCTARGWTAAEFAQREAAQCSLTEKRVIARHTLNNSGTVAALHEKTNELFGGLLAAHRLAHSIAEHGPRAHGGLGPAAAQRHGPSPQNDSGRPARS